MDGPFLFFNKYISIWLTIFLLSNLIFYFLIFLGNSLPDHCPKHGGNGSGKNEILIGDNKDTILGVDHPSNPNQVTLAPGSGPGGNGAGPGGPGGNGVTSGGGGSGKKQDPKEIMKKRRERAICIDRVSRVIFPSTFILLNIIYWLVFNDSKQTFFWCTRKIPGL